MRPQFMGLGHKIYMDMKFSPPKCGTKMRLKVVGGHLTVCVTKKDTFEEKILLQSLQ